MFYTKKEKKMFIIVIIVVVVFVFTPIFTFEYINDKEKERVLNGNPTYEGIVISVTHSAGGWGADITTIQLENITFGVKGLHSLKTEVYYKFWIKDDWIIKTEEVK